MKNELVLDLALEIILGCDKFDRSDIRKVVCDNKYDLAELREATDKKIRELWPDGKKGSCEAWDEEFLKSQLDYWFEPFELEYTLDRMFIPIKQNDSGKYFLTVDFGSEDSIPWMIINRISSNGVLEIIESRKIGYPNDFKDDIKRDEFVKKIIKYGKESL